MPSLSTHVLDTAIGRPANGAPVRLSRRTAHELEPIASATTDADGRVREFGGVELEPGTYLIEFDVAAYLAGQGRSAPFLQKVTVEFAVAADGGHYHVPLLTSPFSGTTYRGS
jgi:5-hydroxyisourate hydrolase